MKIKEQDEWMIPIIRYLKKGWLPKDKTEARKIQIRATRFIIIDNVLYKRGYSLPYLRCVRLEEADYMLREIHKATCGNHVGAIKKGAQSRILLANLTKRRIHHR